MRLFLMCMVLLIHQIECVSLESIMPADWQDLSDSVHERLIQPKSPIPNTVNPFFLEDQPGAAQSTGWFEAWDLAVSPYAVAAESAEDCVAAVNFARKHQLKLVIKGTGHDYLGRSNAKDSLLLWTHPMRKVTMHKSFVPQGGAEGMLAVTVESGARWLEVYQEVTTKNGLYVQGGGCTSVGAAGGFIQGGGFGSFSKKFGTGDANLLEAEVVTADGKVLIANAYQNEDLFWALKGGGGGTFGVVTKVTLKVHPLPSNFGVVEGKITAKNDESFKKLIEEFIHFYREKLNNEHFGEVLKIKQNNSIDILLVFQGLSKNEVEEIWKHWKKEDSDYKIEINITIIPANKLWDYDYLKKNLPQFIQYDNQSKQEFWWAGDGSQVSMFWYAYQSRWLLLSLFEEKNRKDFSQILFDASRWWDLELHFNKGLSGASMDAVKGVRETPMNPVVLGSAALIIMSAGKQAVSGVNADEAREQKLRVSKAMKIISDATPGSGCYLNEADYFLKDWQQEFFGENYPRLLKIKQNYDPDNFFRCHHSVGS